MKVKISATGIKKGNTEFNNKVYIAAIMRDRKDAASPSLQAQAAPSLARMLYSSPSLSPF
ncbi:hypothetical protein CWC46_21490 [Prodigiosinella confusarubida]|uniref:Uncharacterized protein n=1 Tax=Serratia sp. (strain ATCC 39006) TaxID=104623 RepID=A0A800XMM7_SERS3|nr:hypothetical protein CWC46_21490 [Serratia sp. ATCC 39006]